jgi:hypothetical protein
MIWTTPCRRITLHFSHIGFTDALTFISSSLGDHEQTTRCQPAPGHEQRPGLLEPIRDPSARQVIR